MCTVSVLHLTEKETSYESVIDVVSGDLCRGADFTLFGRGAACAYGADKAPGF